ncbi:uncharacterized protein (TIGR04222 family) [Blastococcus colisei]|uniref:Uncharacterized protein (TIGR04222 family) n=2 Tax=Blastococcus colisei TaxID=1564162 RepID=A0A543PBD5_9ACTN|nr:uncharacterized protein (TIGR04222 family) [Blastococcus colisei]
MAAPGSTPHLDLYDLAFLAGGPDRVVDTAVVALVESGRVRVHAPGRLAVVEPGRQHPIEAAVMDAVGTHGHRSIDTVHWRVAGDVRLTGRGPSLAAAGLLRRRRRLGRRHARRPTWSATGSGRQALLRAMERPPTDPALDGGSALRVALHGRQAMPDTGLRAAIFDRPAATVAPDGAGIGRRLRKADRIDLSWATLDGRAAIGGAAAGGFIEGGAGDGGGF